MKSHIVVTCHGIRSVGKWQTDLEEMVVTDKGNIRFEHFKLGWRGLLYYILNMIPLLGDHFGRFLVKRITEEFEELLTKKEVTRLDIVAHSFGTMVVVKALQEVHAKLHKKPAIHKLHTLILAGSVLNPTFPIKDLKKVGVKRIVNECGNKDLILVLGHLFIPLSGLAGKIGFCGVTENEEFRNRYYNFGHRGFFQKSLPGKKCCMQKYWKPLLNNATGIPGSKERANSLSHRYGKFFTLYYGGVKMGVICLLVIFHILNISNLMNDLSVERGKLEQALLGSTEIVEALNMFDQGGLVESEKVINEIDRIFEKYLDGLPALYVEYSHNIGSLMINNGSFIKSKGFLKRAILKHRDSCLKDESQLFWIYVEYIWVLYTIHEIQEMRKVAEDMEKLSLRLQPNPEVRTWMNLVRMMSNALMERGVEFAEFALIHDKCSDSLENLSKDPSINISTLSFMLLVEFMDPILSGKFPISEGDIAVIRAQTQEMNLEGGINALYWSHAWSYANIIIRVKSGDFVGARNIINDIKKSSKFSHSHWTRSLNRDYEAYILFEEGRPLEAIELYARLCDETKEGVIKDFYHVKALVKIAIISKSMNEISKAELRLRQAMELCEDLGMDKSYLMLECYWTLLNGILDSDDPDTDTFEEKAITLAECLLEPYMKKSIGLRMIQAAGYSNRKDYGRAWQATETIKENNKQGYFLEEIALLENYIRHNVGCVLSEINQGLLRSISIPWVSVAIPETETLHLKIMM